MPGRDTTDVKGYLAGIGAAAAATAIGHVVFDREQLADVLMVFLLGIVAVAVRFRRGPALAAAIVGVLAFDFFFVPPYLTLVVSNPRHVVTLAVMCAVALLLSGLMDRIRAQADAAHRAGMQVETERLRSALLSSVSHDLRTPLAVITGSATTLLEEGLDAPTRRDLLVTIREESDRLNRLVRNLLDMTRLEGGGLSVHKEWQVMEEVVGSALARVEDRLGGRSVSTSLPLDLPMVPFDSVLVEQVLINLLENAIKYTPEGSPIDIAASVVGDDVMVSVSDRGPGVPVEAAERIFEKFHRATDKEGGFGLGLAICRGIVIAHGGRLWLEPRSGGGAEFRFTLPRGRGAPDLAREEEWSEVVEKAP
jgi:two-component system, OmpR family, sensor histidine kinase KdpD